MKMVMVSVRDSAARCFSAPTFHAATGVALRQWSDAVNKKDSNNLLSDHPEDFELYSLGEFDDQTGKFELHESPTLLSRGKDVVIAK